VLHDLAERIASRSRLSFEDMWFIEEPAYGEACHAGEPARHEVADGGQAR
jgi:hypothetical protein